MLRLASFIVASAFACLACGDDDTGSPDVDARPVECNCPAAEPPLAGRIVEIVETASARPGMATSIAKTCSDLGFGDDAILLSGACGTIAAPDSGGVYLMSSDKDSGVQWACKWYNDTTNAVDVRLTVTCLAPEVPQ